MKTRAMNAKRTITGICSAITMLLMTTTGAHAAAAGQKVYSSGILVLLFLGFCALVVVLQMIPAMIHLYGIIKGVASKKSEAAAVKAH